MLTLNQLEEMLDLQEKLEVRIGGPNWREAGHDYPLCIHMECAEIVNHIGWKHWKDTNKAPDYDAIAMELVDVWHFALAHFLQFEDCQAVILLEQMNQMMEEYDADNLPDPIILAVGMGYLMVARKQFTFANFYGLMQFARMNWNQLYKLYIGKNVLNWFRQEHGYKEGTYFKFWAGKEDNQHLQELVERLEGDLNSATLYDALKTRYALATR